MNDDYKDKVTNFNEMIIKFINKIKIRTQELNLEEIEEYVKVDKVTKIK